MNGTGYISISHAADHLDVTRQTVDRYIREGLLTVTVLPISGHRRILRESLEQFIARMKRQDEKPVVTRDVSFAEMNLPKK